MKSLRWIVPLCLLMFSAVGTIAQPSVPCAPCTAPDNGSGTADFPAPCSYAPCCGNMMHMVNGFPSFSAMNIDVKLGNFYSVTHTPGGLMGGESVTAGATLSMKLTGTGIYAGYTRNINMLVFVQFENAPRTAGALIQPFDQYIYILQGQLPPGDPDFDLLRITAGNNFSLSSLGHTTFSKDGGGWSTESFFDVVYRIDFVGHSGGPFHGMSGSTTDQIRLLEGCPRWVPGDAHVMHYPQHPDETGWDVQASYPRRLADDWTADATLPVKDLHWWGSFLSGVPQPIKRFYLAIYGDVPAGIDYPYSHPGTLVWADTVSDYVMTPITPGFYEGWYGFPRVWVNPRSRRYSFKAPEM